MPGGRSGGCFGGLTHKADRALRKYPDKIYFYPEARRATCKTFLRWDGARHFVPRNDNNKAVLSPNARWHPLVFCSFSSG